MRIDGIPEEVEQVRSMEELRGLFWVVCHCGRKHRGLVTKKAMGPVLVAIYDNMPVWRNEVAASFVPQPTNPHAMFGVNQNLVVNNSCILEGRVYRVVDPLMENGDVREAEQRRLEDKMADLRAKAKT